MANSGCSLMELVAVHSKMKCMAEVSQTVSVQQVRMIGITKSEAFTHSWQCTATHRQSQTP
ncbi:hypothetical protein HaLaN_23985, partial [Haematococcus lacustris]